ncbi:hypothetical protein QTL86_10565 [Cellulosilyticum sp. ST5]|uniref:hypothetical protein n=1 Tax=Cellulosilyticum sp. ST5 TaxID=3055805 RepID=UPI003977C8F4
MKRLYWKIRYAYEKRYFHRKYGRKKNKVYYDKRYRCYVCPALIEERGPIEYVIVELTSTGLIYECKIDGQWSHDHLFAGVLLNAYNKSERFEVPAEVECQYSQQELDMIKQAIGKGRIGEK